ncbi:CP2 transcription factor family protein-like protein [Tothia fuscella]|uniref:CP2 transcription factor family protein-like protein n=1 Tax=Tothia fuscella TaxID=1048955 RepID=A0A9P4NP98_9PEZI|nr:CP2 transcription factor family protein-like protein [Tothia fuscella]
MFRNRKSSQKPSDELYESFKASFPQLTTPTSTAGPSVQGLSSSTSLTEALDVAVTARQYAHEHEIKDLDPTPRGSHDQWRFTPSILDPNSYAFTHFANQPPGYYTPTPGGTNTVYHTQAGDLHTPGFTMGLGTPLSLPTSDGSIHAAQNLNAPTQHFQHHAMAPHIFQNPNPFGFHHHQHHPHHHQQHQTFHPQQFQHDPSAFDNFGPPDDVHRMDNSMRGDVDMQEHSPIGPATLTAQSSFETAIRQPPRHQPPTENFRYHVTLNAPTAMIKHPGEIPVTYLNKGQAYAVSIIDTQPNQMVSGPVTYRSFIRISFEDEQQRQKPSSCWQLWKEGRGTNEAHHRGGRLQAVEFVDPAQAGGMESGGRPKIELDCASFDGFAVTWTVLPGCPAECSIAVRFNFLSTDFSHSKGVKGIPVRLCAKTELKTMHPPPEPEALNSETCFCKVKLFRDHGAERKLSNDIAHVKKSIDKLKQQIAQAESGMKDHGKRKRSSSITKSSSGGPSRPGKAPKHKRTWSMSSASSSTGARGAAQEEDLQLKLAALQDMFTSTRPASVLYLKGDEGDDPDAFPVRLTGEPSDLTKVKGLESTVWERHNSDPDPASIVSPTPSSQSIPPLSRRESGFQQPTPYNAAAEWAKLSQTATGEMIQTGPPANFSPPSGAQNLPTKVLKPGAETSSLTGWIDAVGIDYSYQPPPERVMKPVACFYVQPRFVGKPQDDMYYRAIYIMQHTLKDLVNGIAMKCNVEATKVLRTIRINKQGLNILLDDDTVREMPEGQDMVAEFNEITPSSPMRREWDTKPADIVVDGDIDVATTIQSEGYELRLLY